MHVTGAIDLPQFSAEAIDQEQFDKILRKFFEGDEDLPEELYRGTFNRLSDGVSEGYKTEYDVQDIKMVMELKSNVGVFSIFKSHSQAGQYMDALVDETGKRRTWNEFRQAAAGINQQYNSTWLETEYNMAVRQARAALQWKEFNENKNVYPNVKYLPSLAAEPSEEHVKYYGIIRPINDPIWDTLWPPSRWGCQCGVSQTREDVTGDDVEAPEPIPGIEGNPGKSGRIFSPTSPFVLNADKATKAKLRDQLNEFRDNDTELLKLKVGKQSVFVHVNADTKDLDQNLQFIQPFVKKYKEDYMIRSNSGVGRKPELQSGKVVGDLTTWEESKSIGNYIQTNWKGKYQKQLKQFDECFIAFDFGGKLTTDNAREMWNAMNGKINTSSRIQFVLMKNGEKVLKLQKKGLTYDNGFDKINKELL